MKRILKYAEFALCTVLILSVLQVVVLRFVPVTCTPLMVIRKIEAVREHRSLTITRHWKSLDKISANLQKAVVASEDAEFWEHGGFSEEGIRRALKEQQSGIVKHGGSTISQQTAKNVFCLPHRTYIRKAVEAYYTVLIELLWGKERILEVYLNVAEMGDGIFGAEAAAEQHFHCTAAQLSPSQSAMIAVCLPNPRKMSPAKPTNYTLNRQKTILKRTLFTKK